MPQSTEFILRCDKISPIKHITKQMSSDKCFGIEAPKCRINSFFMDKMLVIGHTSFITACLSNRFVEKKFGEGGRRILIEFIRNCLEFVYLL